MPESAIAEPQAVETTSEHAPLTAPIPQELQDLMSRVLPVEGDTPAPEPEDGEPPTPPEPEPAPEKTSTQKTTLRLAPDMDQPVPETKPAVPEFEITEEMIKAEKSPKKQADMRKAGEAIQKLRGEIARLSQQPAQPVEDPGLSAVLEQQKAQISDLSSRLERRNAIDHPIFQQNFVQPRNQMAAQAVETVKEAGADADAFERALSLPGKHRTEALDDIVGSVDSHVLRARLERLIDGIDTKDREIAAALKDAKGLNERMAHDQKIAQHQMLQQQEKQLLSILDAVEHGLTEGLDAPDGTKTKLEVLQKVNRKGYEWWDTQVDEIRETAREILLKGTPQKIATAAVLAASCGAYKSLYENERKARIAAEKRNEASSDAEPDLKDRRSATTTSTEFSPDEDITKVALARLKRGDFNPR